MILGALSVKPACEPIQTIGTGLVTACRSSASARRLYHRIIGYDDHILSYRNSTQLG